MRDELDQLLSERYPKIFANRHAPVEESAMGFGIVCGDGWFDLLDTLCTELQQTTDHADAPQVVAAEVKDKWGGLRFYVEDEASSEQQGMIALAQALSRRLCSECGKPGQTLRQTLEYGRLAVVTRCPEHAPEGAVPAIDGEA